jgi:PAS domain S-box-containing protein
MATYPRKFAATKGIGNWLRRDSGVAGKVEHLPRSYILAVLVCVLAVLTGPGILMRAEYRSTIDHWMNQLSLEITVTAVILVALLAVLVAASRYQQIRKQAEEAARESENRYRTLLESLPQMIFTKDRSSRYISCNANYAKLLGIRPEEFAGKSDYDFFNPALAEKYRADDQRVMQLGVTEESVEEFTHNGETRMAQKVKTPFRDLDGKTLGVLGIFWDITARRQAEQELREQAALLDLAQDAILVRDLDSRILLWNRGAKDLYGWPAEEALGKVAHELLQTGFPGSLEAIQASIRETREWEGELRHICRDGKAIVVTSRWSLMRDEQGNPTAILEINRDITERKRAEDNVRALALYARSLLEASLDPLVIINREGRITDANQATETVTGVARVRLIGCDFSNCFTEPDKARQGYERVFAEGSVQDYPLVIRHISGKLTDVFYNASVLKNEVGEVEGVFAAVRDVTERKWAQRALQESAEAFSMLDESVPQLVWMCTPDGLNVYFNQRWMDYTGLTLEESYGKGWDTPFHPDDKQAAWNTWNHALATGDNYRMECRLRAADGLYRWFLIKGGPLRDVAGSLVKWFGTCTDIDDLKRAEEGLRALNEKLEQRVQERTAELVATNKELEAFTYAAAHDLRAPLRHIHGFADILAEECSAQLDAAGQQYLRRIRDGTNHMGRLLEDLLDLARMARQEVHPHVCGLDSIVQEVVAELKADCEDRTIEWKVGKLPFAECDPSLIKQVITNLLSNAVKFTRPCEQAHIEVGQMVRDGESVLFVRDNGAGFDMRYAGKLFGVFQRLHRQQDFEGTGVGLAIVERIVHKHGGRVWAEAELNKGATFYFTLGALKAGQGDQQSDHEQAVHAAGVT